MDRYFYDVIFGKAIFRNRSVTSMNLGTTLHDQTRQLLRIMCWITTLALTNIHCVHAQEIPKTDATRSGGKIDPKVINSIRSSGTARVFVRLNVQIKTQEKLRPEEKQAQLERIRAAQDAVLKELAGTDYKLSRKFDVVPTLSMEIGQDALAVLEGSSLVLRVSEIEKVSPYSGEIIQHK